jgi:hypothetical protein
MEGALAGHPDGIVTSGSDACRGTSPLLHMAKQGAFSGTDTVEVTAGPGCSFRARVAAGQGPMALS